MRFRWGCINDFITQSKPESLLCCAGRNAKFTFSKLVLFLLLCFAHLWAQVRAGGGSAARRERVPGVPAGWRCHRKAVGAGYQSDPALETRGVTATAPAFSLARLDEKAALRAEEAAAAVWPICLLKTPRAQRGIKTGKCFFFKKRHINKTLP